MLSLPSAKVLCVYAFQCRSCALRCMWLYVPSLAALKKVCVDLIVNILPAVSLGASMVIPVRSTVRFTTSDA
jgi:hypothetical protein